MKTTLAHEDQKQALAAATLDFEAVEQSFEVADDDTTTKTTTTTPKQPKMLTNKTAGIEIVMNNARVSSSKNWQQQHKKKFVSTNPGVLNFLTQPQQQYQNKRKHSNTSPAFKSNRRKSVNGSRGQDTARVAKEMCSLLAEPKEGLMRRALTIVGVELCLKLCNEVQNVEAKGGMQTADGSRRRTPGGVFWALFKQRVSQDDYDNVFAEERAKTKERNKRRAKRERSAKKSAEENATALCSGGGAIPTSWASVAKTPAKTKKIMPVATPSSVMVVDEEQQHLPSYEEMVSDNETPKTETKASKLFDKKKRISTTDFKREKEKHDDDSLRAGKEKQDAPQVASFEAKLGMVTPKAVLNTKMNWADDAEGDDMFAEEVLHAPVKKKGEMEAMIEDCETTKTEKPVVWKGGASFAAIVNNDSS